MPAYNFQNQFVEKILDGRKFHTIRRRRKRPTRPGEILKLFTGQRTKKCQLIVTEKCKDVKPIQIYPDVKEIILDEVLLTWDEIRVLDYHDGFDDPHEFLKFFERYPERVRERELEVIYWR